ncbi:GNAT family N-acetyltransferase, partial [Xanthovirga aplysinae]|uniref:GNAT family N-acetyltransferase n=1 Tax=Xanthovirga aplysinae TaxID=2529853 RepID=UPI0012BCFB01
MITLKSLLESDVTYFYKWVQDEEVIQYSMSIFQKLKTEKEVKDWYFQTIKIKEDLTLGIYLNSTSELIGYAGITKISKTNHSGEFYILIGEKKLWGLGIGTEVTRKILQIGFSEKGLHRIMLTVSDPNIGGCKAYERSGFKLEGRLRDACFRNGKYHDKLLMSIL